MKNEFRERLINFTVMCINASKHIHHTYSGDILQKQFIRSSTSVSLNYGEVIGSETQKDFIHKMRIHTYIEITNFLQ